MKLIACSVLLLVILGESFCKSTSTVNRTTTTWGYRYELNDTKRFKLDHDEQGYHIEPIYNNTSSDLKKHFNSRTVYDHFTSPGATNDSQSHSPTNGVNNDTSNGASNSRSNGTAELSQDHKEPNKVFFDTSAGEETTTEVLIPLTTSHTVTVADTQTDTPLATYPTVAASNTGGTPVTSFPNGLLYKNPFGFPTVPLYNYPKNSLTYGPPTGQMYGPPTGQMYWPPTDQVYGQPAGSMYGPPTGPMYGPPTGPMYGPPTCQMYVSPTGPMYGPPSNQMYWPPTGPMYGPQNGQTYGYPTNSLYGSYSNY